MYIVEPLVEDEEREAEENDEWQGSIRALKNYFVSISNKSEARIIQAQTERDAEK